MELMRQQAVNFGTRIITDDVVEVDLQRRPFVVAHARRARRTKRTALIIATGARANYLGLPSEEAFKNRGVSACAVCDGALPRFRNKPLVVVGGGDSAVEEATLPDEVRLEGPHGPSPRQAAGQQDHAGAGADESQDRNGVESRRSTKCWATTKKASPACGSKAPSTTAHANLPASGVFLAIGHTPNTAFLKGQVSSTTRATSSGRTPFRTDTSVEGVFAAGDVADDYYRQAITSAGTGCMAALDAERWLAAKGIH